MVRLIMGANGAGKTKQLIELIHTSVESETGSVVCIEPKGDMTYDVSYNVRLVNAGEYNVDSLTACADSCAVCTRAITIFPMCSWIISARSPAATTCRR